VLSDGCVEESFVSLRFLARVWTSAAVATLAVSETGDCGDVAGEAFAGRTCTGMEIGIGIAGARFCFAALGWMGAGLRVGGMGTGAVAVATSGFVSWTGAGGDVEVWAGCDGCCCCCCFAGCPSVAAGVGPPKPAGGMPCG
jgi:hypothetical protein